MAELTFMKLLVTLSVLIKCCENAMNAASFALWPVGSYISGPEIINSFSMIGADECLLHCITNNNCVATNVDTTLKMCELLGAINCNDTVYQNGDWRVIHNKQVPGCLMYEYKGCYIEISGDRDFEYTAYKDDPENTPHRCSNACADAGYKYMGLKNRDECWCSDSYGLHGLAGEDSFCWHNCTGDATYKCGSGYKNSVYELIDYRNP